MYSIKRLFKQQPAAIVTVLNLWLAFFVVVGVISWSGDTIAAFTGAANATLLLGYVKPSVVSTDALTELQSGIDAAA